MSTKESIVDANPIYNEDKLKGEVNHKEVNKVCSQPETTKGVVKYTEKKTTRLRNYVLHWHAKHFTSLLEFLELLKTSQPDDESELIMNDGNRKNKKDKKLSVGGRLWD